MIDNSEVESIDAKASKLIKDLIEAMNEANNAKEKVKELNEELKVEKMLVVRDDNFCPTCWYPSWPDPNGPSFTQPDNE